MARFIGFIYRHNPLTAAAGAAGFSLFIIIFGCSSIDTRDFRDGDIIFQTSMSAQSLAIQEATHSKYSHMGIILIRDTQVYVFEAVRTVQFTPVQEWITRGEGGHYVVKRLRGADRILTRETLGKLKTTAAGFEGKPYDPTFEWSDSRMYCSELVWKIYHLATGIDIGQLRKLREFDLSSPKVKAKLRERYGENIPWDETVISPSDILLSEQLITVIES